MAAEEAAHMGLVAEAAGLGDFGQGHFVGQDHVAGALNAMAANESCGRHIECDSKGVGEARDAQLCDSRQIGDPGRRFEVGSDVTHNATHLPGRKAAGPAVRERAIDERVLEHLCLSIWLWKDRGPVAGLCVSELALSPVRRGVEIPLQVDPRGARGGRE